LEDDRVEHLRDRVETLISSFRNEVQKLEPAQRLRVGGGDPDHYLPPTQIEVIWIQEPDFQIVFVSHFKDRKDREIIINGPLSGHELLDKIDALLKESRWTDKRKMSLFQREPVSPADVAFDLIVNMVDCIQSTMLYYWVMERPAVLEGQGLNPELWALLIAGNIAELEPKSIFEHALDYARHAPEINQTSVIRLPVEAGAAASPGPAVVPVQHRPQLQCTTTHFYPPILVGELPKPTIKELFTESRLRMRAKLREVAFETSFAGYKVMFSRNGLMCVTTQDKEIALRIFNLIFGAALLQGIQAIAVRESEVGTASIDLSTKMIVSSMFPTMSSLRSMLDWQLVHYRDPSAPLFDLGFRIPMSPNDLGAITAEAEKFYASPDKAEHLVFLLEASTHMENAEFPQAFMMGWIIVERHISKLWDGYLREKGITGQRKEKLTESMTWSVDHYLESLNLVGQLDDAKLSVLMRLKKKRNDFIHEGGRIIRDDASECLTVARDIVEHERKGIS
jgi:hypothetical protein